MNTLSETLTTPVKYECDVCVAGGGFAGIAAALSAARAGKECGIKTRVLLLERSFMLGGLATSGLVTIYLPLCDGRGNQVCYGIADELFKLSIKHGAEAKYPDAWLNGGSKEERAKSRFMVQFNAQLFAILAEQLLRSEGVKILYGVTATATTVEDKKITHVIIEGKGGREAISVKRSVIDTTGDCDICKLSGARTEVFSEGNKLAAWYYGYGKGEYKLYMCGVHDTPDAEENTDLTYERRFSGLDTDELSEMIEISHATLLNNFLERRKTVPDLLPVTIATTPEIRMTRRLVGKYEQDITEEFIDYPDAVGIYPNWKKPGPIYALPLSALYGDDIKNLLVAGRCISASDAMWDITRVIPVCAVSGEAAGVAATLSGDIHYVNVEEIRACLRKRGVLLECKKALTEV